MHKPLRKAAILVSTLDSAAADALLDQMPPDVAVRVRQAVLELGPIDPAEQKEIIDAFLGQKRAQADAGGVELDASLVRRFAAPQAAPIADVEPAPFRSLHEATPQTLARLLAREHPQTVALVAAHLPAARAAEIVSLLPKALQTDVLRRVADLDETNPEVLRELEQSLANLLADELRAGRRRTAGLAAVGAILDRVAASAREGMLSNLAQADADLAARLAGHVEESVDEPDEQAEVIPRRSIRLPFFWRRSAPVVEELDDEEELDDDSQPDDTELEDPQAAARFSAPPLDFDDISRLSNSALAAVLQKADPRITLLALTGAPQELVERLLGQLPRKDAQALRKRLAQSGPLRLRDVETAQQQLAAIASGLAAQGKLTLPTARRFAAAA